MRFFLPICLLIFGTFIVSACSGGNPSIPGSSDNYSQNQLYDIASQTVVLDSGRMNLDTGTIEPGRDSSAYMNVTRFIGSNFWFVHAGYLPPDQHYFNLNMQNTSGLTVYDVNIVFEVLYGKTIINEDSYIDIFEPYDLDPYLSFRKAYPDRAFPDGYDSFPLIIEIPPSSPPTIDYFFIAHLGGNTGGVYEIDSTLSVAGSLTSTGGLARLTVTVRDHQDDVSIVVADTKMITGDYTFFEPGPDPFTWEARVINTEGAPAGIYELIVMATSPSVPDYNTYQIFNLEVVE